ncbi:MAG: acyl-CoA dehydrogenase family protein, partial [Candidatus Omnitrophota bacterium]|nr:acyl-CoA dehydrogenase family protein [Candidatus Omnitrophota bacterium]
NPKTSTLPDVFVQSDDWYALLAKTTYPIKQVMDNKPKLENRVISSYVGYDWMVLDDYPYLTVEHPTLGEVLGAGSVSSPVTAMLNHGKIKSSFDAVNYQKVNQLVERLNGEVIVKTISNSDGKIHRRTYFLVPATFEEVFKIFRQRFDVKIGFSRSREFIISDGVYDVIRKIDHKVVITLGQSGKFMAITPYHCDTLCLELLLDLLNSILFQKETAQCKSFRESEHIGTVKATKCPELQLPHLAKIRSQIPQQIEIRESLVERIAHYDGKEQGKWLVALVAISQNNEVGCLVSEEHIRLHPNQGEIRNYFVDGQSKSILYHLLPEGKITVLDLVKKITIQELARDERWFKKIHGYLHQMSLVENIEEEEKILVARNILQDFAESHPQEAGVVVSDKDNRIFLLIRSSIERVKSELEQRSWQWERKHLKSNPKLKVFTIKVEGKLRGRFGKEENGKISLSPNDPDNIKDAKFIFALAQGLIQVKSSSPVDSSVAYPIIFNESKDQEWVPWLLEHLGSDETFYLAEFHAYVGGMVINKWRLDWRLKNGFIPNTAAIISPIQHNQKTIYMVVLSDIDQEHLQPLDGWTILNHRTPIDLAVGIINNGLYSIPGSLNFNTGVDIQSFSKLNAISSNEVVMVFRLPNIELGSFCGMVGFTFSNNVVGARLPEALREQLKRRPKMHSVGGTVRIRDLLMADKAGLLLHHGPDTIDIEKTLVVNALLVDKGVVSSENYKKLKDAFEERLLASSPVAPRNSGAINRDAEASSVSAAESRRTSSPVNYSEKENHFRQMRGSGALEKTIVRVNDASGIVVGLNRGFYIIATVAHIIAKNAKTAIISSHWPHFNKIAEAAVVLRQKEEDLEATRDFAFLTIEEWLVKLTPYPWANKFEDGSFATLVSGRNDNVSTGKIEKGEGIIRVVPASVMKLDSGSGIIQEDRIIAIVQDGKGRAALGIYLTIPTIDEMLHSLRTGESKYYSRLSDDNRKIFALEEYLTQQKAAILASSPVNTSSKDVLALRNIIPGYDRFFDTVYEREYLGKKAMIDGSESSTSKTLQEFFAEVFRKAESFPNYSPNSRIVFLKAGADALAEIAISMARVGKNRFPDNRIHSVWATMGNYGAIKQDKKQASYFVKYLYDQGILTPDTKRIIFVDTDSRIGCMSAVGGLGTERLIYRTLLNEAVIADTNEKFSLKLKPWNTGDNELQAEMFYMYLRDNNLEVSLSEEGIDSADYRRLKVSGFRGKVDVLDDYYYDYTWRVIDEIAKIENIKESFELQTDGSVVPVAVEPYQNGQKYGQIELSIVHYLQYAGLVFGMLDVLEMQNCDVAMERERYLERLKQNLIATGKKIGDRPASSPVEQIFVNLESLSNRQLNYGLKAGGLLSKVRSFYERLNSIFLRHGFNMEDADRLAQTIARMKNGSLEIMQITGVITDVEKDVFIVKNIVGLNKINSQELVDRLRAVVNSYAGAYYFKAKMMQRLVPLSIVDALAFQFDIAPSGMRRIIMWHPNFPVWLHSACIKVQKIQDKVGGSRNAWEIIHGHGIEGADSWIKLAESKVGVIEDLVGGSGNAWMIVIGHGVEKTDQWLDSADTKVNLIKGRVCGVSNAWHIVISHGVEKTDQWFDSAESKVNLIKDRVGGAGNAWAVVINQGLGDIDSWIKLAESKVNLIKSRVCGAGNAWVIVIGRGVEKTDQWLDSAETKVNLIKDRVGSSYNAWKIVMGQGIEKAEAWIVEATDQAVKMIKSGEYTEKQAWEQLIKQGLKLFSKKENVIGLDLVSSDPASSPVASHEQLDELATQLRRQGFTAQIVGRLAVYLLANFIKWRITASLLLGREDKRIETWFWWVDNAGKVSRPDLERTHSLLLMAIEELLFNIKHAVIKTSWIGREYGKLLLAYRHFTDEDGQEYVEITSRNLIGNIPDIKEAAAFLRSCFKNSSGRGLPLIISIVLGALNLNGKAEVRIISNGKGVRFVNPTRKPIENSNDYQVLLNMAVPVYFEDIKAGTEILVRFPVSKDKITTVVSSPVNKTGRQQLKMQIQRAIRKGGIVLTSETKTTALLFSEDLQHGLQELCRLVDFLAQNSYISSLAPTLDLIIKEVKMIREAEIVIEPSSVGLYFLKDTLNDRLNGLIGISTLAVILKKADDSRIKEEVGKTILVFRQLLEEANQLLYEVMALSLTPVGTLIPLKGESKEMRYLDLGKLHSSSGDQQIQPPVSSSLIFLEQIKEELDIEQLWQALQQITAEFKAQIPVQFIHSRPENRTLQGADEQWPLSISLQETAGFSPRSFIQELYIALVDKPSRLASAYSQQLAKRNDIILKRMRESTDLKIKALYQGLEDWYIQKLIDFLETRVRPISQKLDDWDEWPSGTIAGPMKNSSDPQVQEIYQRIQEIFKGVTETSVVPLDLHWEMAKQGLLGPQYPQQFGGLGLSEEVWVRAVMESARQSSGFTVMQFNVNTGVYVETLKDQSDEIKTEWMAPVLNGEALGAFLLTEPNAGSYNAGLTSWVEQGKVSGENVFITNMMILPANYQEILQLAEEISEKNIQQPELLAFTEYAQQIKRTLDIYITLRHMGVKAARTQPKNEKNPSEGISVVLVNLKEKGAIPIRPDPQGKQIKLMAGVLVQADDTVGQKGSGTATVFFDKVVIGPIIGSLSECLRALASGRGTVGAHALGISQDAEALLKAAIVAAKEYAIAPEILSLAERLWNEIHWQNELMRLFIMETAQLKDQGEDVSVRAALSKLFASELATTSTQEAYEMAQNLGVIAQIEQRLAMRLRDAYVTKIYEGTNEIQRIFVITPALLKNIGLDYQSAIEGLKQDERNIAAAIIRIIELRNLLLSAYRAQLNAVLPVYSIEELPSVTLKQVAPFALPEIEMLLLEILAGYRAYKNGGEEAGELIAPLRGLMEEFLEFFHSKAFNNLSRESQMVLEEALQKTKVALVRTQSLSSSPVDSDRANSAFIKVDLKITPRDEVKILELGMGWSSDLIPDIYSKFWVLLANKFNLPVWLCAGPVVLYLMDGEGGRKALSLGNMPVGSLVGDIRYLPKLIQGGSFGKKHCRFDPSDIRTYFGIIIPSVQDFVLFFKGVTSAIDYNLAEREMLQYLKNHHPEFLIFDFVEPNWYKGLELVNNKLFSYLLMGGPNSHLPRQGFYPTKYAPDLASRIKSSISASAYVIKDIQGTRNEGVIIVKQDELDSALRVITGKEKGKGDEKWLTAEPVFLVQEFVAGKPIVSEGDQFEPTIRTFFVLTQSEGEITVDILDSYYSIPAKPIGKGSLQEQTVSINGLDSIADETNQLIYRVLQDLSTTMITNLS